VSFFPAHWLKEVGLACAFLEGRILSVGEDAAEPAAELFNAAGRKRTLKTNVLIADGNPGQG
jgi:hypothetical protein